VNPAALSTTNALVSECPSGDGKAGGHFSFVITLLAGDANYSLTIDSSDYVIWSSHYGQSGGVQIGDYDGDGIVTTRDLALFYENYGLDLRQTWMLADLNGDSVVDFDDMDILYSNDTLPNPTRADGDLDGDGDIDLADVDLAYAQLGLALAVVS
jgi:hypothetical protein